MIFDRVNQTAHFMSPVIAATAAYSLHALTSVYQYVLELRSRATLIEVYNEDDESMGSE